jgi:hypothetical protein
MGRSTVDKGAANLRNVLSSKKKDPAGIDFVESKMNAKPILTIGAIVATVWSAAAGQLKSGTEVNLTFRQEVNSKTAKPGDAIAFVVKNDVTDGSGRVVIKAGTPVRGTIEKVDRRDHFGKNARIRISINPIHGIAVQPRDKGAVVGGTRSDEAGAISGGAALLLGPLGLAGGYFVVGHNVDIHPGQTLRTVVSNP